MPEGHGRSGSSSAEHSAPLLIDAKSQFVGKLSDVLAPFVLHHVQELYVQANSGDDRRAATYRFQSSLRDIPHWNASVTQRRAAEVAAKYPFLDRLIAACFVANVKILAAVKLHDDKPNVNLRLPSNELFVHRVYVNVAREFYGNPLLVKADRPRKAALVRAAVEMAINELMPMEDILKAYLEHDAEAAESDGDEADAAAAEGEGEGEGQGEGEDFGAAEAAAEPAAPEPFGGDSFGTPPEAFPASQLLPPPPADPAAAYPPQAQAPQAQAYAPQAQGQPQAPQAQPQAYAPQQQQGQPGADPDVKRVSVGLGAAVARPAPQQQQLFADADDEF